MSTQTLKDSFQAIVVGSGATGGVAALGFTQKGLKTLVLEAGPDLGKKAQGNPVINMLERLKQQWISKEQSVQASHPTFWESNPKLFIKDSENPYTTPKDKPFYWIRGRQLGGKSHTWGGVCLRFSDYEFKEGWPIAHKDLAPFYSRLEKTFNVHGTSEQLDSLPDGSYVAERPLSPGEKFLKKEIKERFGRSSTVSRGIYSSRRPDKNEIYSRLSSNKTTLAQAKSTGNLTIQSNAIVSEILVDPKSKKAIGVEYVDTQTGKRHHVYAPIVMLCASTIETVRILMNSKSEAFPNGIGASSGLLGKAIMDHIVNTVFFYLPNIPETSEYELLGSDGMIIPRYNLNGSPVLGYGFWGGVSRVKFPSFIRRKPKTALGFFCCMGEAEPSDQNYVSIDNNLKDKWGIPSVSINCAWTKRDLELSEKMRTDAIEMVKAVGGVQTKLMEIMYTPFIKKIISTLDQQWEHSLPGLFVHEVGGARMGHDPKTSVTNSFSQVWDCTNVVIGDGASFVTSGWQNPTLTEMALCLRASEYCADQYLSNLQ